VSQGLKSMMKGGRKKKSERNNPIGRRRQQKRENRLSGEELTKERCKARVAKWTLDLHAQQGRKALRGRQKGGKKSITVGRAMGPNRKKRERDITHYLLRLKGRSFLRGERGPRI